ncbi:hypothetical protein O6H91_01G049800 [Diphasiastrum complanatum]|uniref:Uncharacterized protein n=1 Tax=Diphasiastrum complanatum TaxID=34168 RepID=A0ACC2EQQ6_DIPCM|nr:hypothetical protein O6H91_01G049800 [Diphasiastrum complanatum]
MAMRKVKILKAFSDGAGAFGLEDILNGRWLMQLWRESLEPCLPFSCYLMSVASVHSDAGKKNKRAPLQERKMVDRFRLCVRGGEGGSGCASFRKSRHFRHGAADGGNGGKGGSVILECSAAIWDFSNLQHHVIVQVPVGTVVHLAKGSIPSVKGSLILPDAAAWQDEETQLKGVEVLTTGCNKQFQECLGSSADAINTENTLGTIVDAVESHLVYDSDGNRPLVDEYDDNNMLNGEDNSGGALKLLVASNVAELVSPGECLVVASGGPGGRGNTAIARGCGREKALPSRECEPGQPGSEAVLILELKTIADVGLVGAPNAGKSTLLGAISRAKPMVGHYAFTTLRPNIGKVVFEDYFALTVADIPGLIQGAHEDRGLGFAFLRHIERTKALAYVLDLASALGDNKGISPWDQFDQLQYELEKYQIGLSNRPSLVVANKIDEDGAEEVLNELRRRLPSMQIYPVCAVLEEGINALKWGLRTLVDDPTLHATTLSQLRM